jgi:eukaryotic-like serine/threonine-protein kinase
VTMGNLATRYSDVGRYAEALQLHEDSLKLRRAKLGPDHPYTLESMIRLAETYAAVGRFADSLKLRKETLELRKAKLGPNDEDTLASMSDLACSYTDLGRYADALKLFEETLTLMKAKLGADEPETLKAIGGLATTCERANDLAKAEALCRQLVDARRQLGSANVATAESLARLGQVLIKQGKYNESEPVLRESLAVWDKHWPDNWRRFWAMSLLGGAQLGLARYSEAEPLLLKGDTGLQEHQAQIPAPDRICATEARARLVALYTAWGKKEQAESWRKRQDQSPP